MDPRFSKHFGRKITNGVDKLFNTGVPCKSRLCELDPELQRAVGFRCSCRKGTGKWESGVGVGEVGIVRRGTV